MIFPKVVPILGIMVVVSIVTLSGCIAFRSSEQVYVDRGAMPKEAGSESVSVLMVGEMFLRGKKVDARFEHVHLWRKATEQAFRASGRFSDVRMGAAITDLRVEVAVTDRVEDYFLAQILSAMTAMLIPFKVDQEFIVTARFLSQDGKDLGTFEKREVMRTWVQLFLLPFMQFRWPPDITFEVVSDLNRAIVAEALDSLRSRAGAIP